MAAADVPMNAGYVRQRWSRVAKETTWWPLDPSWSPTPTLEDACFLWAPSRGGARVKACAQRLLLSLLGAVVTLVVAGCTTTLVGGYEHQFLGLTLLITGLALAVACWAVYVATCAEESRAMFAALTDVLRGRRGPASDTAASPATSSESFAVL
ncbi:hypothetical protein HPB48_014023 [Haemaphysalis longicornis]|uniref:Uncharacterized protein n=1 Tax=Haemaphysalis longicornis TaxID=44386 RepID=A0A9J6FX22_HAELO|nr:hypothetical protein HPB48_014023 [Haemaphysalis longicornis]